MRLAEAQKLKPGDAVLVEDWFTEATHAAQVIHATPRGGILVAVNGGRAWVPFSRVHRADVTLRKVSASLFR